MQRILMLAVILSFVLTFSTMTSSQNPDHNNNKKNAAESSGSRQAPRVTGIGGIFFKSSDPKKLYEWYEKHLGIKRAPDGSGAMFHWKEADGKNDGMTIWSIFPKDTKYFNPSKSSFMINYRVENLDALLEAMRKEGVEIDPKRENYDYGRFAWIIDPDGNRIELWEPPKR